MPCPHPQRLVLKRALWQPPRVVEQPDGSVVAVRLVCFPATLVHLLTPSSCQRLLNNNLLGTLPDLSTVLSAMLVRFASIPAASGFPLFRIDANRFEGPFPTWLLDVLSAGPATQPNATFVQVVPGISFVGNLFTGPTPHALITYVPWWKLHSPFESLASTTATVCPAGSYQNGVSASPGIGSVYFPTPICLPCLPGYYAPFPGVSSCTVSPVNTFASGSGNTNYSTCPSVSTSPLGSSSAAACVCPSGSSKNGGVDGGGVDEFSCSLCPAGTAYDAETLNCVACGVGSFAPFPASTACQPVDPGFYATPLGGPFTGQSQCTAGQYLNATAWLCMPCPAASFAPTPGALGACQPVPAGSHASEDATSYVFCTAGGYLDGSACQPCAPGSSSSDAAVACAANPPGQAAVFTVSSVLILAGVSAAGWNATLVADVAAAVAAVLRVNLSAVAVNGDAVASSAHRRRRALLLSAAALPFTVASWSGAAAAALQAPTFGGALLGALSSSLPLLSAVAVAPPTTAVSFTSACGDGEVVQNSTTMACTTCAANTFAAAGAASCAPCAPGWASMPGASACSPCVPGTFFDFTQGACRPCGVGLFAPLMGATACQVLPAGTIASFSGGAAPPVPVGYTVCPAGSFASVSAQACLRCAPGTVAPQSSAACSICTAGTYANSSSCLPCPLGASSPALSMHAADCTCASDGSHPPAGGTCPSAVSPPSQLGPVLGGVLGGVALLAAGATLLVLRAMRRRAAAAAAAAGWKAFVATEGEIVMGRKLGCVAGGGTSTVALTRCPRPPNPTSQGGRLW